MLGFCPRGLLSYGGFVLGSFCPRGVLSYTPKHYVHGPYIKGRLHICKVQYLIPEFRCHLKDNSLPHTFGMSTGVVSRKRNQERQ